MISIEKLFELIPHRYPMMLVDRILDISEDGQRCRGIKNVTINEPFFQGHYPGKPIMPGVLILESIAQVGAALLLTDEKMVGRIPLIGAIDNVKFRRIVQPGDQLLNEVEILWIKGPIGKMKGVATVEGEMAATMEMTFKLQERER